MFLIIDFEATCWPKTECQNENEIIEIGAVLIDKQFNIIYSEGLFVRPLKNPILSDFCKNLTTIKQTDVDSAEPFNITWKNFENKVALNASIKDILFCSWGYYDRKQLALDCKRFNMPEPFTKHFNIKHEFAIRHDIKPCGLSRALQMMNMPFEGTHHRGIDDAINIANIFVHEWQPSDFI